MHWNRSDEDSKVVIAMFSSLGPRHRITPMPPGVTELRLGMSGQAAGVRAKMMAAKEETDDCTKAPVPQRGEHTITEWSGEQWRAGEVR